jgi:hypothetical protein
MSLDDTQFSNSALALSQVFGTANFVGRDICVQDDLRETLSKSRSLMNAAIASGLSTTR